MEHVHEEEADEEDRNEEELDRAAGADEMKDMVWAALVRWFMVVVGVVGQCFYLFLNLKVYVIEFEIGLALMTMELARGMAGAKV